MNDVCDIDDKEEDMIVLVFDFLICFDGVIKIFGSMIVFWDVLFEVVCGEIVVFFGFFGLGKFILLCYFDGFEVFIIGVVEVLGLVVFVLKGCVFWEFCCCVGFIFQQFEFVFLFIVFENVFIGLLFGVCGFWFGLWGYLCFVKFIVFEYFDWVGLFDCVYQCSDMFLGGQQQCVVIVCVFMQKFVILFVDELVVFFDFELSEQVMVLICEIVVDEGFIVVCSLYQVDFVISWVDCIVGFCYGEVVFDILIGDFIKVEVMEIYGCVVIMIVEICVVQEELVEVVVQVVVL